MNEPLMIAGQQRANRKAELRGSIIRDDRAWWRDRMAEQDATPEDAERFRTEAAKLREEPNATLGTS